MAYQYKSIYNPKTGQSIEFLLTTKDSKGKMLTMETCYDPHSLEPPAHYHPTQEEEFQVISGELTVRLKGEVRVLKSGDSVYLYPGTVHAIWNASNKLCIAIWKVVPALNTEEFLETAMGLAAEGKTNKKGMPRLLQGALLINKYSNVFRLAKLPYSLQQIFFAILVPVAYLTGLKPFYKKYID